MKKNANIGDFIERSLIGIISFLKSSLFAEEYVLKSGFMQSLDPRIKILSFIIFIILAILTKSIPVILALYLLCLFLVCISKINPGFFLKRTWVFIPLFSLFIGLPAMFSSFTPGQELFSLKIAGLTLVITRPGVLTVLLFVLRVVTTVSFAVLLSITTRHFELLIVWLVRRSPQAWFIFR